MRVDAPIRKWIAKLYKDHDQYVDNLLADYNLNHSEGNLLVYLYKDGDGISQNQLKENLAVDKATVSRAINSLIEKDYLKKEKSPEDGRVNLIYLSQKAYAVKEEINQIYQQWFKKFLDEIEENEAEKVINTLEKMYKIIQKRN
ncbi:DNA-binding MarR family transcriptional regulator [Halanaerobium saccharolyticum]|jgi:DNA-binding MarR family transcriptional regulator|uniref:DNA-binding MarR family transcriptional regulator n=1 Tax=Halanaerobium saccharolyticum TaxID=43595 RepID=A0A2T5RG37_9FIRM|nr:MarR family transcriptional regulator [Halanaerobium saccharolyticum]PTV93322.1 DNA-binding MarR family transcriptional regulator [Halanaerobium saccharolyticum]TDP90462.1 DNA-binding MarR family transcriptional regulator [Halanaerobium saccharolyticum]